MSVDAVTAAVAEALRLPQAERRSLRVEPLERSGNNRIYIVTTDDRKLLAKQYFQDASDRRHRLEAEQAFLAYAARAGVRCVPATIASDPAHGLAIYEYVEGHKLATEDITAEHVWQAAEFFLALNRPQHRGAATGVPDASEACFTISGHIELIQRRIDRLKTIPRNGELDEAARLFADDLAARWRDLKADVVRGAQTAGLDVSAPVQERCISPSDFGFHNALLRKPGELCFLDFEYAGWDDPAKMVGDFFTHPGVPVPPVHFEDFLRSTMRFSAHHHELEQRARLLMPLFRVKWCCIVLNEFLPDAARRRRFADPRGDQAAGKRRQVEKARQLFASI